MSDGATLGEELGALADETGFSGVAVAHLPGREPVAVVGGHADRANRRPNTLRTRFGIASATKGLTALAVASLVDDGILGLDTTLRSVIGDALPLVDDGVTVRHLLEHTSGVGDYLDEDELDDVDAHVLGVAAHELANPTDYLQVLDGHPQRTAPGERFAYNNGGYVMLSVAVEAVSGGLGFHEVVRRRVLEPAGMHDTAFDRSDDLGAGTASGYLRDGRTNVFHLPVRGAGDGGVYSTVADLTRLWAALFGGAIVAPGTVDALVAARHTTADGRMRYGRGFWLRPDRDTVMLEGMDAGVSCRTAHDRTSGIGYTVVSNTSDGAWPLVGLLDDLLPDLAGEAG